MFVRCSLAAEDILKNSLFLNNRLFMEDDRIRELFNSYAPEISSDREFLNKLGKNMDSLEFIRCESIRNERLRRKALFAACIAGFAAGVLFTLVFPYISRAVASLISAISVGPEVITTLSWIIVGSLILIATFITYDISSALIAPRKDVSLSS